MKTITELEAKIYLLEREVQTLRSLIDPDLLKFYDLGKEGKCGQCEQPLTDGVCVNPECGRRVSELR